MKVTRVKNVKKITSFYTFVFKLDQPLRVYLHHSIVSYCLEHKLDLQHLLQSTFQQPIKVTTLKCTKHLPLDKSIKKEMKKYLGHECDKDEHTEECFHELNGVLCIQDSEIRQQLNQQKCVPFMYFNNSTLVMEPISELARKRSKELDLGSRKDISDFESNLLNRHKVVEPSTLGNDMGYKGKMPSRRKAKGPNPLSCKSKVITKRSRRRPKVKISE
eukprot:NODE_34_length_31639_cov_0.254375.p13 type:complete len:217 gc:universal NODE_34_length_31639_cov_0.254375:12813-13463(+)